MNNLKVEFNLSQWIIRTIFACSFIAFPVGIYLAKLNFTNLIYLDTTVYIFCIINFIFFGLTFTKIFKPKIYQYLLISVNIGSLTILLCLYALNNSHEVFLLGLLVPFTFINIIYHSYRDHLLLVSAVSIITLLIGLMQENPIINPFLAVFLIGSIAVANNLNFLYKILNTVKAKMASDALDHTNSFLLIFDTSEKIIQVNKSFSKLILIDSPKILSEIFEKDDIKNNLLDSKRKNFTTAINTPYNGILRVKWKKKTIQNSIIIVGYDATDEEIRKDELENLSLVAYKSLNGVVILDGDYNVSWINQALEKMTGYSLVDLKGRKPSDVIKVAQEFKDQAMATRQMLSGFSVEIPHYKKDGTLIWLNIDSTPIYDSQGKLLKQVETVRDITIQKTQEIELKKLSLIANYTAHSVIITDNNMRVEWVNEAFQKDTGYTFDEIVGNKVYGGLIDKKEIHDFVSKIGKDSFELTHRYKRKDGIIQWAKLQFNLVENGYKYIIVAMDVTDEIENVKKLELYSRQNKISSSLSKTLLRNLSFEEKVYDALEIICELKEDFISSSFIKYDSKIEKAEYFGFSKIEEKNFNGKLETIFNKTSLNRLKQGLYFIENDLMESVDSAFKNKFLEIGVRSYVMYPIFIDNKLYGSINIRSSKPNSFKATDIIPLQDFSNSFSFFIKNNIANKKIEDSEQNFRQLNESLSEVFWLYDVAEEKSLYVSKSIENLFGYQVQNFLDDNMFWTSCVHEEDKQKVDDSFEKAKQTGVFEETYRIVTIDDDIKWVEEKIFPIKDENGNIIKLSGIAKDVTFKIESEQKLKSLAFRLETTSKLNNAILANHSIDNTIIDLFSNEIGMENIVDISILTFDYKNEVANYYFSFGNISKFADKSIPLENIRSLKTLIKEDFFVSEDLTKEKDLSISDDVNIKNGSKSYIITGIKQNDMLIGSLNLSFNNTKCITEELKETCATIASSISLSLLQKKLENEITTEKENLFKSNKNITDSIVYATRIQNAHLPNFKLLEENKIQCNLIYLPKDIVSGDFYWWAQIDNKIVIALADCTGHGVPGALMTILGANYLKLIVEHNEIVDPGMILSQLNISVYNTLYTKNASFVDGMDITVLTYDRIDKTIEYASAKRPLIHLTNNTVNRYPGEIYSIGEALDHFYETKSIEINTGDKIFLYSDGIVDQFGGPKNKKFSSKRLFKLIGENSNKTSEEIHQIIDLTLLDWKGSNTQIDDISLLSLEF